MDSPKMIQSADDALLTIELGESDDDTLNEVRGVNIQTITGRIR